MRPRPSARGRHRHRTGGNGSSEGQRPALRRRQRVRHRATPRTSRCWPTSDSPTTGCPSNGPASSRSPASTTRWPSPTTGDVLTAAREAGVAPWVCLHHFTLPALVRRRTGLSDHRQSHRTLGRRHVGSHRRHSSATLSPGGSPSTKSNYYALSCVSRTGLASRSRRPRGVRPSSTRPFTSATAEAAVRLKQTGAPVASIFGLSPRSSLDDYPRHRALTAALAPRLLLDTPDSGSSARACSACPAGRRSNVPTWPARST